MLVFITTSTSILARIVSVIIYSVTELKITMQYVEVIVAIIMYKSNNNKCYPSQGQAGVCAHAMVSVSA